MAEEGGAPAGGGGGGGFLSGTVDIPKIGKVKKVYIAVAVAAVGGVVIWLYWQASQVPEEETGLQPETETGFEPGGGGGGGGVGGRDQDDDAPIPEVIDTNQEWFAAATEYLTTTAGYDSLAVADALGKYLAKARVTETQASMIRSAVGAVGQPPEGRPWSILIDTTPAPSVPGTPRAPRVGKVSDTAAELSWDAVPSATRYLLYRDGVHVASPGGTSHTATGLSAGKTYRFAVRALNSAGKGGPIGPAATVTTGKKLSAPTGLKVITSTPTTVTLGWNAVPAAVNYSVYRGSTRVAYGVRTLTWKVTGLQPGGAYTFFVGAVDASGKEAKTGGLRHRLPKK